MLSSREMLWRVIGLAFAAALPLSASAQVPVQVCKPPAQKGSLTMSVEARQSPGAPAGLHLVVTQLPTGDQIAVSDSTLKSKIIEWVEVQKNKPPKHDWLLDGKGNWNLINSNAEESLARALGPDFTIYFAPLPKPLSPKPPEQMTVGFCFTSKAKQNVIKPSVQVSTALYNATQNGAGSTPKPKLLPPIALPPPAESVTASALIADADFSNAEEQKALLDALSKVAAVAWNIAQASGLAVGNFADEALLKSVEKKIDDIYSMQQADFPATFWEAWPYGGAKIEFDPATGDFTLKVRGVRMVKSASAQVNVDIKPLTKTGRCKAEVKARQSEQEINQRFADKLAAIANTVPTFKQIESLREDIAANSPEIKPPVTPAVAPADKQKESKCEDTAAKPTESKPPVAPSVAPPTPAVILFSANNRWAYFGFDLSVGGGYSPEEKATGKLNFSGDNLLLRLPEDRLPKETESLTYTGGNEVQKVNAAWALDWTHIHTNQAQTSYGIHVPGDYLQDLNQRFGNLTGPVLSDRERGIKPSVVYAFSSRQVDAELNPVRYSYGVSAEAGLEYRHVNISPSSGSLVPPRASGTMTAVFMDLTFDYSRDTGSPGRGGFGGFDVGMTAHALRGLPASDFAFTQALVSAQGTLYFGFSRPRDFFVRFRQGAGTSNGATPLFEMFRLGGTDTLRGIEQGEFVGRKIAFQQSEVGVSAYQIVRWFSKKSSSTKPSQPSPLDLSKIYLKGFYDRGRVADSASFSELVGFSHAAKGYGAAVELQGLAAGSRRVNVSIGYARSPDSVLHHSGLVITGVSFQLGRFP